jgi:hypothetical protein
MKFPTLKSQERAILEWVTLAQLARKAALRAADSRGQLSPHKPCLRLKSGA